MGMTPRLGAAHPRRPHAGESAETTSVTAVRGRGSLNVHALILAIALAAAGVWTLDLLHFATFDGSPDLPWWVLATVFLAAEVFVVHVYFRSQAHSLSATEIGLVLGLFFISPAGLLVAQMVGASVGLVFLRRQKSLKLAFNLAELALCSGLAVLIFHGLVSSSSSRIAMWLAALLAAAVAHTCGILLVSLVMSIAEGGWSLPRVTYTTAISLLGALSMASLGLLAVEILTNEPAAVTLLIGPVLATAVALRGYWQQRQERERVEFLYESMRATQGSAEFGLAVGQLLVAARRLLRAGYAEIVLLSPVPSEPPLRSLSGPSGERLMQREVTPGTDEALAHTDDDRPLLLPSRREPHPLDGFLATRDIHDAIIGRLHVEDHVLGLLVVGERVSDVSTFGPEDLALFETFCGHASVLLENGRLERSLAEETALRNQLSHQAYHDALTGLPNRLMLQSEVNAALERDSDQTHSLLFLDLDRFKEINDTFGHAAGDELLQLFADRLQRCLRPDDTAARLGGDEFAVLLRGADEMQAELVADRVAASLTTPFTLSSGRRVPANASIGIASSGSDASTTEDLLQNADVAMYTAKTSGQHRSHYDRGLHTQLRRNRQTARDLERGLKQGEIIAHFQPVVSLADGTIQAFEALARWQHPDRGLLNPDSFLEVAEDAGLIAEVGAAVRQHAFRCAAEWQGSHPDATDIGLWVNLAPAELTDDRLLEEMALALTRAHLDPTRLTVEITESTVGRDEEGAIRAMRQLREIGIHLSIDDFGTGYSSLARLAEYPLEMLKIPKPFVDRLTGPRSDAIFVDAILRLAGSLGLTTVSEGIEHPEQAEALTRLGCGLAQGFLYSPAVPDREAFRMLRTGVPAARLESANTHSEGSTYQTL